MTSEVFGIFRPWEIARLSDYQIRHVYLLPAINRMKRAEGKENTAAGIEEVVAAGQRPSKAAVVSLYMCHGMSQESANRLVEDQWREWDEMDRQNAKG